MNINRIICFLILTCSLSCNTKKNALVEKKIFEDAISCSLELNQDRFLVGDELILYFIVENNTGQVIYIDDSPYGGYFIEGKRKGGFDIKIEDSNGQILKRNTVADIRSGRYGIRQIDPNEKLKIRVHDVFKYGITNKEGNYTISIDKQLLVYLNRKKGDDNYMRVLQSFEKPLEVYKKELINVLVSNTH